jgi:hypothetical protein
MGGRNARRPGYAGNRLPKSSARDLALPGSARRGKREAASLATLRLAGKTLKTLQLSTALPQDCGPPSTAEQDPSHESPPVFLVVRSNGGVPCLVVGPLHAARRTSVCLGGTWEQESPVPQIRARPPARVTISAVASERVSRESCGPISKRFPYRAFYDPEIGFEAMLECIFARALLPQ